jgi:hypothetical protein
LIGPVRREIAIVVFEVVDSPFRPRFRIKLFMSETRRVACTGSLAGA